MRTHIPTLGKIFVISVTAYRQSDQMPGHPVVRLGQQDLQRDQTVTISSQQLQHKIRKEAIKASRSAENERRPHHC